MLSVRLPREQCEEGTTLEHQIERILTQLPGWSAADAVVTPLEGGITNQNYRVESNGKHLCCASVARVRICWASTGDAKASACYAASAGCGRRSDAVFFCPAKMRL